MPFPCARPMLRRDHPTKGGRMANLIGIAYPDQATAEEVLATLAQ